MTKRLLRFAARGYTIVELSIVLVVIGLLLSGAIASFDRWSRYEQAQTTRDSIDLVKKAVVQYAARNRTAPREITVRSKFSRVTVRATVIAGVQMTVREAVQVTVQTSWNMPPSRLYLPCPDIDGDGIEDRVENPALLNLTLHIRGDGGLNPRNANDNLFYRHGLCSSQRGLLPWRTLRAPAADAWGGLFSYYVDSGFSHSLVGFNQNDHADQLDTRRPLDVFGDALSEFSEANQVCYSVDADQVEVIWPPLEKVYQCPQYRPRVEAIDTGDDDADQLPALVCDFGPCSPDRKKNDALTLSSSAGAGAVVTEDLYRFSEGEGGIRILRLLEQDEDMIYEAPAFVVISHGPNGYGAVAVANTQVNIVPDNLVARRSLRCASFPDGDIATPAYLAERQNAWRLQALGDENLGDDCPQVNVENDSGDYVYRRNYTARADPDAAEFDDVVGWMEVDVLKARLSEIGALPAPGLPPFGI